MEVLVKTENLEWQDVAERFVLYIDIGGFKDRVRFEKTNELYDTLKTFRSKNKQLKPLLDGGKTGKRILMKMAQFSDSIVVVSAGYKPNDLNRITKAAVILIQTALKTKFAIRGVIACGEMVFDEENQLFFGKSLVDAYLLEQQMCHYGVIFHHTAEEQVKKALSNKAKYFPIGDCETKLKGGDAKHYQVLWHKMNHKLVEDKTGKISKDAIKWLENLRTTVSGYPRTYLDNTRKFIEQDTQKEHSAND